MSNWYAIRTAPQREFAIEQILRLRGVTAFVPTETKWRRVGAKKKRTPVQRPMLPRYIMIQYPDPWVVVRAMEHRGVSGVVCFGGVPAPIPERSIAWLAKRSGAAVPTRTVSVHRAFAPGDKVEIVSGPYRGWCVELKSIRGEVGKVLVRMFGTEMPAEIRLDDLEAA